MAERFAKAGDPKGHGHRSLTRAVDEVRELLRAGQYFQAFDLGREALAHHPDDPRLTLLSGLALMRTGAVREARKLLAPLDRVLESREARDARAQTLFSEAVAAAARGEPVRLDQLAAALFALAEGEHAGDGAARDPEIADLLSEIYLESWRRFGDAQDLARGQALVLARARASGDFVLSARAAVLTRLRGDARAAAELAETALARAPAACAHFEEAAALGVLSLLGGEGERAEAAYRQARALGRHMHSLIVAERERLAQLERLGVRVPAAVLELLRPPVIVTFAGTPVDAPHAGTPVFPAAMASSVRAAIDEALAELGADIGYCTAAAGADILFIEAMLERGAQVHVLLPCRLDDFLRTRVAYAGPRWERRFHAALKLATSVAYVCDDPLMGHAVLFRHANRVIDGSARLHARSLGTRPHLLAVYDYGLPPEPGSAADFIDHWGDPARLRVIDLEDIRSRASWLARPAETPPPAPPPMVQPERIIACMLFADVVGFSRLQDHELPGFWAYMAEVRAHIAGSLERVTLVESWGDALYIVTASALDMAELACGLIEGFAAVDPAVHGLGTPLSLRIGLHAGPVFPGTHPLTGRKIVYGGHVNRAARIEPVTVPGHIYASAPFVAQLTAEESAREAEAWQGGADYSARFACEYLGVLTLAKNYGDQAVYHLARATRN